MLSRLSRLSSLLGARNRILNKLKPEPGRVLVEENKHGKFGVGLRHYCQFPSIQFKYNIDEASGHGELYKFSGGTCYSTTLVTSLPNATVQSVKEHCDLSEEVKKNEDSSFCSEVVLHEADKALISGRKTRFKHWYSNLLNRLSGVSDEMVFHELSKSVSQVVAPCFRMLQYAVKHKVSFTKGDVSFILENLLVDEVGGDGEFFFPHAPSKDPTGVLVKKDVELVVSFLFSLLNRRELEDFSNLGENIRDVKEDLITNDKWLGSVPTSLRRYATYLVQDFDPNTQDMDIALAAPLLLWNVDEVTTSLLHLYLYFLYDYGRGLLGKTAQEEFVDAMGSILPTDLDWQAASRQKKLDILLRAFAKVKGGFENSTKLAELDRRTTWKQYDTSFGTLKLFRDGVMHYQDYLKEQMQDPIHPDDLTIEMEKCYNTMWLMQRAALEFADKQRKGGWSNEKLEYFKEYLGYKRRLDKNMWASIFRFRTLKK